MNAIRLSVGVATYNGAEYVEEQLASILADIGPDDEVIVVDDGSVDSTLDVVASMRDGRIRVVRNERNRGHIRTFERALAEAKGRYIALSDQDDVWVPGRTERMLEAASIRGAVLVAGNFDYLNRPGVTPAGALRPEGTGRGWTNVVGVLAGRTPYFGSCMLMNRQLRDKILPFPASTEAHDHWIALCGNVTGTVVHLGPPAVTLRRVHGLNLTPERRRSVVKVLRSRWIHIRAVAAAFGRRR